MYKATSSSGKEHQIQITDQQILIDGEKIGEEIIKKGADKFQVIQNNKVYTIELIESDHSTKSVTLKVNHQKYTIVLKDNLDQVMERMGITANSEQMAKDIKAPMPGMILNIDISEGEELKKGDQVLILEAMKMENIIKAPADVRISKILVGKGDSVEKKQVLVEFE